MADGNGEVNFEVQSAYLEGKADLAERLMALADRAQHHSYAKGMVIREIRDICSATMQHDALESA